MWNIFRSVKTAPADIENKNLCKKYTWKLKFDKFRSHVRQTGMIDHRQTRNNESMREIPDDGWSDGLQWCEVYAILLVALVTSSISGFFQKLFVTKYAFYYTIKEINKLIL